MQNIIPYILVCFITHNDGQERKCMGEWVRNAIGWKCLLYLSQVDVTGATNEEWNACRIILDLPECLPVHMYGFQGYMCQQDTSFAGQKKNNIKSITCEGSTEENS